MGRNICDSKKTAKIHTPACAQIDTHALSGNTNCTDQGLSYSESMKYISPGSGLHESMFSSLEHTQYYELDIRLTFKGYQCMKGARRKTIIYNV